MSAPSDVLQRQRPIRLVALYRNARHAVREIASPLVTVGQDRSCDIVLGSNSVAPVHAAIVWVGDAYYVCDLGSPRAALINGRPIRCHRCQDQDVLSVGNFRFRIEGGLPDTGSAETPRLAVTGSRGIGRVESQDPILVIGSHSAADVVIAESGIAPVQCLIAWTAAGPLLRNATERGPVRVEGKRVDVAPIRHGQRLEIGGVELIFECDHPLARDVETESAGDASRLVPSAAPHADRFSMSPISEVVDDAAPPTSWDEAAEGPEAIRLDLDMANDVRDLREAQRRISEAKEALERKRRGAADAPELSDETVSELTASRARGSTSAAPPALPAEFETLRRLIDSERAALSDQRMRLDFDRGQTEAQQRELAAARRELHALEQQLLRRQDELADDREHAAAARRLLEEEREELDRRRAAIAREIDALREQNQRLQRDRAELELSRQDRTAPADSGDASAARARGERSSVSAQQAELEQLRREASTRADEIAALRRRQLDDAKNLKQLQAQLAEREEALVRSGTEAQQRLEEVQAQLSQARTELAEKTRAMQQQAEAIQRREAAVVAKAAELRQRVLTEQEKLAERGARIRAGLEQQREHQLKRQVELDEMARRLDTEREALRREVDTAHQSRTRELDERERNLEQRAAALRSQSAELDGLRASLAAEGERLATLGAELTQRRQTAAELEGALNGRDERLREWQRRVVNDESRVDELRAELTRAQAEIAEQQNALAGQRAELEERIASLRPEFARLEETAESVRRAQRDLERQRLQLAEREASFAARQSEIETLAAHLAEKEHQYDDLTARIDEAARREQAVAAHEADLVGRMARMDARERELQTRAARIERRESELSELTADLHRREESLRQARADFEGDRVRAEQALEQARELQRETDRRSAAIDQQRVELERQASELAEARRSIAADRRALDEEIERQQRERTELKLAQDALTSDLAALARDRNELDARATALAEEAATLDQRRGELNDEAARLAAQRAALSDGERRVAAQQRELEQQAARISDRETRVADAEATLEQDRQRLEPERRRLADRESFLAGREAALIEQDARLDERRRALEHAEAALQADRARFAEEERELAEATDRFEAAQNELEQHRRTYSAGLQQLEDRERAVAARERDADARSAHCRVLQARLEEELDAIDAQRRQLLEAQQSGAAEADQLRLLSGQLAAQRDELRRQEEALIAHDRALEARTQQISQHEAQWQARCRELEAATLDVARERDELRCQMAEWTHQMEQDREAVAALRRRAEDELRAARLKGVEIEARWRESFAAREAELEREFERRKAVIEKELRGRAQADRAATDSKIVTELDQRRAEAESRLAQVEREIAGRLSSLEAELRERRTAFDRELAERRMAQERELAALRSDVDAQIEDLGRRQAALSQAESLQSETSAQLDRQRVALEREQARLASLEREWRARSAAAPMVAAGARSAEPVAISTRSDRADAHSTVDTATVEDELEVLDDADVAVEGPAEPATVSAEGSSSGRRWARWGLTLLFGVLVGAIAWIAMPAAPSAGILRFDGLDEAALREHAARITNPDVLHAASRLAGIDLAASAASGALRVQPNLDGAAIRIEGPTPAAVEALARAYASACAEPVSASPADEDELQSLRRERESVDGKLATAEQKLSELSNSIKDDRSAEELKAVTEEKARRREALISAEQAVARAAEALRTMESSTDVSADVPADELQKTLDADEEYVGAREQRRSEALTYQSELGRVFAVASRKLADAQKEFAAFAEAVDAQQRSVTDAAVAEPLQQLAESINQLTRSAEALAAAWTKTQSDLTAWNGSSDPSELLKVQSDAEAALRSFSAQSRSALAEIERRLDPISRAGPELTKRRVIEGALKKHVMPCRRARSDLVGVAKALNPKDNVKLDALGKKLRDLGRKLAQRRQRIEDYLKQQVVEKSGSRRAEQVATLKRVLADAEKTRADALQAMFVADEAVSKWTARADALDQARLAMTAQDVEVRRLRAERDALDQRLSEMTPPPPAASPQPQFAAASIGLRQRFLSRSWPMSIAIGAIATGLVMLLTNRRSRTATSQTDA